MRVIILGLGYTGGRLAQKLIDQRIAVVGTNRSGHGELPIPIIKFDHSVPDTDYSLFWKGLEDVTHVLSTIAPNQDGSDPAMSILQHHPNPSQITWAGYISTTGVYGDTGGAWVDELSPVNPRNARSQARVEIEKQWRESTYPVHVFRLPGIYGPGRSIFEKLRAGKAQQIIKPGHVFSRVHVDDIIQCVEMSMKHPTPGEIYNVVDNEPSEPQNLLLEGAQLLNIEPPPPVLFEQAQLSSMGRSFWAECRRVSNQKIKQQLGITLLYPSYREGLRAILKEQ